VRSEPPHLPKDVVVVGEQRLLLCLAILALDNRCLVVSAALLVLEVNIYAAGRALYEPKDVLLRVWCAAAGGRVNKVREATAAAAPNCAGGSVSKSLTIFLISPRPAVPDV
jgi:hypothetical protein